MEADGVSRVGRFEVYRWPERAGGSPGWVAMRLPITVPSGARYLRNGWQSWSSARWSVAGEPVGVSGARTANIAPRHPPELAAASSEGSWDVYLSDAWQIGVIETGALFTREPHTGAIVVWADGRGALPDVWVAPSDERDAAVAELLDRCGGRTGRPSPLVWCSWGGRWTTPDGNCGGAEIDEAQLRTELPALGRLAAAGLLDVAQLDDGWQADIGDWQVDATFPSGVEGLVDLLGTAGLRTGLWLAPFCVSPSSELASIHPERLLRDAAGGPVVSAHVGHWGGDVWTLDVTRADVQEWVETTVRQLIAVGVSYLKIDFCYAAALEGNRAVPMSGADATRLALGCVRSGAGDAYLDACGAPLWPSIGIVDAMRIGADVTSVWTPPRPAGIEPGQEAGMASAVAATVNRSMFDGRLWANDPDHLLLRDEIGASWEQQEHFARTAAGLGGLLSFGDRPSDVGRRGQELWAELAEAHRADGRRGRA